MGYPLDVLGQVMTSEEFGQHMALEVLKTTARQPKNETDPELQALFDSE